MESVVFYSLCAAFLLALRDIFGRMAVRKIDPIIGTGASAVLGLPILALVSGLLGDFRQPWPSLGWPLLNIALAGVLRITAARTLLFAATKHIGAARAGTLSSANTFFAILLGVSFLGEILSLPLALGAIVVVGGCVVLSLSRTRSKTPETAGAYVKGVSLALMSALAFGISTALARPSVNAFASPNQANLFANAVAVISYLPFVVPRISRAKIGTWSLQTWGLIALAGSVASLGVTFVYFALARAPVVFVSPIIQSRPFFVVTISWLFFQAYEKVNWRVAVGTSLIFAGTAFLILYR